MTQPAPAVIAYRTTSSPGALYCPDCLHTKGPYTPLTTTDLPDGGTCTCCYLNVIAKEPAR